MAETDILQAKAFLLQASGATGLNLYDHLSDVLVKVLNERPKDAADSLEAISRKVKADKFSHKTLPIQVIVALQLLKSRTPPRSRRM
jgi:hypothetical protein